MSGYKKPKNINRQVASTLRIIVTFGLLAVVAIIVYYGITDGWQSVVNWFTTKWACLVGFAMLIAVTLAWWLMSFIKKMRSLGDE